MCQANCRTQENWEVIQVVYMKLRRRKYKWTTVLGLFAEDSFLKGGHDHSSNLVGPSIITSTHGGIRMTENTKNTCPDCRQRISCGCDGHDSEKAAWTGDSLVSPSQGNAADGEQPVAEEETLEQAKARWEAAIGMASTPHDPDSFLVRSPTGCPLAMMTLWKGPGGSYRPYFGQPVSDQMEWLKEQAAEPNHDEPLTEDDKKDAVTDYGKSISLKSS